MRDTCYLRIDKGGVKGMTKSMPGLRVGEIAVAITVNVDNGHFRIPTASAEITLGPEHIVQPSADVEMEPAPPPEECICKSHYRRTGEHVDNCPAREEATDGE